MSRVGLAAVRPIVAASLIGFGVLNPMRLQTGYFPYGPPIPAGATVIPGVFLIVAGVGTLLNREWAMLFGAVLCLMHLTVSAVTWPLSSVEAGYVVLCAVGVFGSLVVLVQTRKHAAAEKTG
ncbi:MAG: hypothetical protein IT428_26145, partial [Planctomycetaceae bacterium]|nr:hypothetical protein [Planctomycetaceae bacterium]